MADLIIYNGSDKVIKRIVELLNQGGGGGGLVDDVKVNGTSVVDANKVAQIDLTPYAEISDLPTVNNGTLTLKNGDQTKGTFGANQSTAANVVMLPFDITGNTTIGFTPVYPS